MTNTACGFGTITVFTGLTVSPWRKGSGQSVPSSGNSKALTDSANLERSFIILDEVFASQDDGRRDLIINSLYNLKSRFPQILLVTHVDDLKDRVEFLIEVKTTGEGWSEVKING